jgi:RND family efflux transporter MFP subunit
LNTGNAVIIDQAQQQYATAQSRYAALRAEVDSPALHQGDIISAMSGTVTAINVFPGQVFGANKVMLTIFDESSIIIRVKIPLTSYGQIHSNQLARVTPSALPSVTFTGIVMSIILNADPQTNTFEVWINVVNTTGNLLPGMSAFVSIQGTVRSLVVPWLAVLNPDRDSIVFVVQQGHAHIRHVQITDYSGDTVLIGSGLAANDTVVLVGLDSLQDNQQVNVTSIEGE